MSRETGGAEVGGAEPSGAGAGGDTGPLAMSIGTFDGVHRGHQLLLRKTREIARSRGIESGAYTYDVPPRRYLREDGPSLLMEPETKVERLGEYVERVVLGDFHEEKDLTPEEFVDEVLVDRLDVDAVVVGTDWRFGRDRSGSYRDLEILSDGRFSVHPKQQLKRDGRPVSSTWIREALRQGDIAVVRELLGRNPSYLGQVVPGRGVGTELGAPTANLEVDERVVLPREGSYAALVETGGELHEAAVYVGSRPTFEKGDEPGIEVHLLDFEGDLYGERLKVELVSYLDENREYDDSGELKRAIEGYLEEARRVLGDFREEG